MKRTTLIISAAVVILFSGVWTAMMGLRNRSAATGGHLELTERELRLPPVFGDSTALFLEVLWRVQDTLVEHERAPAWLDTAKLTELGFDCSVPVSSPHARAHYSAMASRLSYAVLRLEPTDVHTAGAASGNDQYPGANSRLVAVDAARDPERLRQKYPDAARDLISRALVHIRFQAHDDQGQLLPQPRIVGIIGQLVPQEVFVPTPGSQALQKLRRHVDDGDDREPSREPRFAATVQWGQRYEPWLTNVRLLTHATSQPRDQTR